jgi:hypothetical protein
VRRPRDPDLARSITGCSNLAATSGGSTVSRSDAIPRGSRRARPAHRLTGSQRRRREGPPRTDGR